MAGPVLTLQTSDGRSLEVDLAVAFESPTIKRIVETAPRPRPSPGTSNPVQVPNVKGGALKIAMDFAERRQIFRPQVEEGDGEALEEMKAWEREVFRGLDQDGMFDLVEAAIALGLGELREAACQAVAESMRGKTVAEIRRLFNVQGDYSPEEEEALKRENPWAFLND